MNADRLLLSLPPFTGRKEVIKVNQSVPDIIKEITEAQKRYQSHYRLIYSNFVGSGPKETAENIWNFLKKNSSYVIEPDSLQTIKTPAAILATAPKKYGGNDCKNLSLFTAGNLEAYRSATNQNFDLFFRFAGYNRQPISHVFVVMKLNGKEIWIDPVLKSFNNRDHIPTVYKDKKIENMALVGLSGINPYENNKQLFEKPNPVPGVYLGAPLFTTLRPEQFKGVKTAAFFQKAQSTAQQLAPLAPKGGEVAKGLLSAGASAATGNYVAAGLQLVSTLKNLFQKDAPGDYWKAWERIDAQYGNPIGSSAQHWIMVDGDSVRNEALNLVSYIQNQDPDLQKVLSPNRVTMRDTGRYVTFNDLLDKLRRGGFINEADQIKQVYDQLTSPPDQPGSKKAGMNMIVTLGLVGAAAFFLLRKK
ncbi:MAG: hypothetical protein ACK6DA_06415 [Candidatus Kapaibacterium sp.]